MSTKVMSHKPSSARRTMNNKDTGLNTPISSRNALENMSLNRNGKSGSPSTLALSRFDIGTFSQRSQQHLHGSLVVNEGNRDESPSAL